MKDDLARQVAASLDAPPELLPLLPELLADLQSLGGPVETMLDVVRGLGLPADSRALDLGCGKGALAVELADDPGFEVDGVDAMEAFIDAANRAAAARDLAGRCRFRCDDVREVLRESSGYDLLLWIAMGPLLGDLRQTVDRLRRTVRGGGLMVIDDAFLTKRAAAPPPGYELYADYDETRRRLTADGDEIAREVIPSPEELAECHERSTQGIARRAERLAAEHPRLAEVIWQYVETQRREAALEGQALESAIWVIKRTT